MSIAGATAPCCFGFAFAVGMCPARLGGLIHLRWLACLLFVFRFVVDWFALRRELLPRDSGFAVLREVEVLIRLVVGWCALRRKRVCS